MPYRRDALALILPRVDLGNAVAENDEILETARVETSVFTDLLEDRVDLIPGTKGSGKSALFRIFTNFLPNYLLQSRKVAVAHGVYYHGDHVFRIFERVFNSLNEDQFVDFWCIYLVKIAYTDFIQNPQLQGHFSTARKEIAEFVKLCEDVGVPTTKQHRSFTELLESVLGVLARFVPTFSYDPKDGSFSMNPAGNLLRQDASNSPDNPTQIPKYVNSLKTLLDEILRKSALRLWLMIDRLDEIFPRRSDVETKALRGLLRTMKEFSTKRISLKVFLRDDILSQVTDTEQGFTALTHITARQADKLKWSEDQILLLIVRRLFSARNHNLIEFVRVDVKSLVTDQQYRTLAFYKVFPDTMPGGMATLRWIYEHAMDGQQVVTPRDIIDLLTRAKQRQQDELNNNSGGVSDWIIGPTAIQYGFEELAKRKRDTLLKAEYPHLWKHIKKFEHGKSDYTRKAVLDLIGKRKTDDLEDLVSIGFLCKQMHDGAVCYHIPHIYQLCLEITPGLKE